MVGGGEGVSAREWRVSTRGGPFGLDGQENMFSDGCHSTRL